MNSIISLYKSMNGGYEITTVYEDGTVEIKLTNSNDKNKIFKVDFIDELEKELKRAYNIMVEVYDKEKNESFCVRYNNHDFYSFDLYMDISLMIKQNKMKKLSVYNKYKENIKEEKQAKSTKIIQDSLDELESKKTVIDILNATEKIDNERNIISFEVEKKNNFLLGETRFFSNTIDINTDYPKYLEFVGQINLDDISKYDRNGMLPKNGMLYFFQSPLFYNDKHYNFGKVIYVPTNKDLVRKNIEITDDSIIMNLGITNLKSCIERFSDRYENENDKDSYDPFKNDELNKIYGFYTDCQMDDSDIKKVSSKYIVLLQLGSNIYGEGVTTFLIKEEDLKNKNFDNVIYQYSQS